MSKPISSKRKILVPPVNDYSRNSNDSWSRSNWRNRFPASSIRASSLISRAHENSFSRCHYINRGFNSNRIPSQSRYTEFFKRGGSSRYHHYSTFRKNRYRPFSRKTSKNRQFFRNYKSPSGPPSRPQSKLHLQREDLSKLC